MARATLPKDPEIRALAEATWMQKGWPVELNGSGHWRVVTPASYTGPPIILPSTPSDYRSVANCMADLRRAGIEFNRSDKLRKTGQGSAPQVSIGNIPRNMKFNPKTFGDALDRELKQRNLHQEELAAELGVTGGSLSLWRRGIGRPSMDNLLKIMRILEWGDAYGKRLPAAVAEPKPEPKPEPEPEQLVEEPAETNGEHPAESIVDPELLNPQLVIAAPKANPDELPYLRVVEAINQMAANERNLKTDKARLEAENDQLRAAVRRLEDEIKGLRSEHSNGSGQVLRGVKVQVS